MSENTTNLREADNKVTIVGTVSEISLEVKEVNGKEAMTGSIAVETDENSVYTVEVFSYKEKKDGGENSIFKGLQTVMDEYKSIAKHGREEADKVKITGAKLTVNDYYTPTGELRSFVKVNTNFVNRLKAGEEFVPEATFEVEMFIHKMIDEVDKKTGEVTDRKIISGIVPIYNGKVVPMEVVVADPEFVSAVDSMYEQGQTVKVYGDMVSRVITTHKVTQVAIGKPKETTSTTTTRELIFTGGSEPYLEDSNLVFDVETIKNAMAVRAEFLEELKAKKKTEGSSSSGKPAIGTKNHGKDLPF